MHIICTYIYTYLYLYILYYHIIRLWVRVATQSLGLFKANSDQPQMQTVKQVWSADWGREVWEHLFRGLVVHLSFFIVLYLRVAVVRLSFSSFSRCHVFFVSGHHFYPCTSAMHSLHNFWCFNHPFEQLTARTELWKQEQICESISVRMLSGSSAIAGKGCMAHGARTSAFASSTWPAGLVWTRCVLTWCEIVFEAKMLSRYAKILALDCLDLGCDRSNVDTEICFVAWIGSKHVQTYLNRAICQWMRPTHPTDVADSVRFLTSARLGSACRIICRRWPVQRVSCPTSCGF